MLEGGEAALRGYEASRDALSADLFEVTDAIASCAWSMDDLAALHTRLSEAMAAEGREMTRRFGGTPWIGMSDSAPSVA